MLDVEQITIVGTGLLGGSIGLGLRAAGYRGRLIGVGRRAQTLDAAIRRGCIDEGSLELEPPLAGGGLVILATPLGAFGDFLQRLAEAGRPLAAITDVGSTKAGVCDLARRILGSTLGPRFIGAHPMAGGEMHGPESARAGLFEHMPCILTPPRSADPQALALVETLWTTLGMRLVRMSAEDHDRTVARISHLPHALAVTLMRLVAREGGLNIASTGFRDTTRIASGDPQIWRDIFTTNRTAVVEALDQFVAELTEFRTALADDDEPSLSRALRDAKAQRDAWTGQRKCSADAPTPRDPACDNSDTAQGAEPQ